MRDVRDGELTWNAFIDAIAEKALITGGGHHGYRRGFAVRVYGVRAIYSPCYFRELPKLARARYAQRCATSRQRNEMRCQIRSGQSETRKKAANTLSLVVQQFQARRRCLPSPWVSATSMPERANRPAYRRFSLGGPIVIPALREIHHHYFPPDPRTPEPTRRD